MQVSELEKKLREVQEQLEESYTEGRKAERQLRALQEQLTEGQQHTARLEADLASRSAELAAEQQVSFSHLLTSCCAISSLCKLLMLCSIGWTREPSLHSQL